MQLSKIKPVFVGKFCERRKKVRLEQDDNKPKIQVIVKQANRDAKTGKIVYQTLDSFNVIETTGSEVVAVVNKAFGRKA